MQVKGFKLERLRRPLAGPAEPHRAVSVGAAAGAGGRPSDDLREVSVNEMHLLTYIY